MNKNIPANTTLVRANASNGNASNKNHTYFMYGNNAVNKVTNEYAKYQGNKIHTYVTKKPLKLINMSKVNSIKMLLNSANENAELAIKKSFRISNNKVLRKSKLKHDVVVSRLLCKLGYDGYYAPRMDRPNGGKFHQEIMLCNPRDKIRYVKSEVPFKPLAPRVNTYESPPKRSRLSRGMRPMRSISLAFNNM